MLVVLLTSEWPFPVLFCSLFITIIILYSILSFLNWSSATSTIFGDESLVWFLLISQRKTHQIVCIATWTGVLNDEACFLFFYFNILSSYLMILYLISIFALVLQFCSTFIFLLVFTFVIFFFLPCLFLVFLYPFCSAFEVSLIFTLLLCRVFRLFIYFFILLKKHFLGGGVGGGVSAKLMSGYNMGGGAKLWIHWPGWCFWLCPVELANVPGWQMTTRHSFPRLGPNPRVITVATRLTQR